MTSISIKFITLILIIIWDTTTHGLTGYHCGYLSKGDSLLYIGECTQEKVIVMSQTYLQFLRVPQNDASTDDCDFDRYNVLHEGMGKKLNGPLYPPVFAGIMENVTFALRSIGYRKICDRTFYMTEYTELLIFETSKNSSFATKTPTDYIDIFMYVNEKFVYPNVILENIALQMQLLYHNVLLHKCYKSRENMIIPLTSFDDSITISSDFFTYFLIKSRGYVMMTIGEITHILKCLPIDVTIRKTKYCNNLIMSNQNGNVFLTPIICNNSLISDGTEIDCNPEKPAKIFVARNKSYKAHRNSKIDEIETIQPRAPSMSDLAMTFFYNANVTLCYIIVGTIVFGNLFREEFLPFMI